MTHNSIFHKIGLFYFTLPLFFEKDLCCMHEKTYNLHLPQKACSGSRLKETSSSSVCQKGSHSHWDQKKPSSSHKMKANFKVILEEPSLKKRQNKESLLKKPLFLEKQNPSSLKKENLLEKKNSSFSNTPSCFLKESAPRFKKDPPFLKESLSVKENSSFLELQSFLDDTLKSAFLRHSPQRAPIFLLEITEKKDLDHIERLKNKHPLSQVLVVFSSSHVSLMRQALKRGAFYVFQKPLHTEEFLLALKRIEFWWDLQKEDCLWRGKSPLSQKVKKEISFLKEEKGPFLIEGESGTGKDVVAHLLCFSHRPFLCVNMATLNENLFESQMFGFKKGAFF